VRFRETQLRRNIPPPEGDDSDDDSVVSLSDGSDVDDLTLDASVSDDDSI
jgi:hypothetical protein